MSDITYDLFLKNLNSLKETAILQGGYVTEDQISEAFPELNDTQKEFIKDYFAKNNIGINQPLENSSFLTPDELNLFQMYLDSLESIEVLSDSVKRVLMMEAISGNKDSRERLMKQYLNSVIDTARLYTGQGVDLMDLIGEGNVALAIAMEEVSCCEGPDDVEPLIMKMVMNAMEELVNNEGDSSNVDSKVLGIVEEVGEKAKALSEELLRKVTIDELVKESGLSAKRIKDALSLSEELYDLIEKEE